MIKRIKLRYNTLLLGVLHILWGCGPQVEKTCVYYDNGKVKEEVEHIEGTPEGKNTMYYPDGKIQAISYFSKGKLDGVAKSYYGNGQLKYIRQYKNGTANGEYKYYYPNGILCQTGTIKNGLRKGSFYDYSENGRLKRETYFLNIENSEYMTSLTEYEENGKIVKRWENITLKPGIDTIDREKDIVLTLGIPEAKYDSVMVIKGDFEDDFTIVNNTGLDTVFSVGQPVTVRVKFTKEGNHFLRGLVINYGSEQQEGDTVKSVYDYRYFEKPVYVRPAK